MSDKMEAKCELDDEGYAECKDGAWQRGFEAPPVGDKNYPDPEVVGCGWKLVRRRQEHIAGYGHPTNDMLRGFEPYGNYEDNAHSKNGHFSIRFDHLDFDEFLFSTSEGRYWMIVDKEEFYKLQGSTEIKYRTNPYKYKSGWPRLDNMGNDSVNYQLLKIKRSSVKNSEYQALSYLFGERQCRHPHITIKHMWIGMYCDENGDNCSSGHVQNTNSGDPNDHITKGRLYEFPVNGSDHGIVIYEEYGIAMHNKENVAAAEYNGNSCDWMWDNQGCAKG